MVKIFKGVPYTGTLPATLTGTKAGYLHKYKIYGNLTQNGTPTPENPIYPSECGELETAGVHAGQYKLPLASAGQEVDIYLGENQTTRQIKKLVLTGEEEWKKATTGTFYSYFVTDYYDLEEYITVCSHYIGDINHTSSSSVNDNACCFRISNTKTIYIRDTRFNSGTEFMRFLAQQYANGTPVTIWYVLATPTTSTLNEPLRKIGNYADTIDSTQTSAQIPTSANSTTISWAGSGLAPSEFDSIQEWVDIPTYKRVNGEWVADN